MERNNMPVGFGMELSQNTEAMRAFSALTETQQQAVLQRTRYVHSRSEMRQLVEQLAEQK